jgi:hypothetical protein
METWATTLAGLEPTMRWHSSTFLALDELNLLGSLNDKEVQRLLQNAVFKLNYGTERAPYGASIRPQLARLCWASTSNVTIYNSLLESAPEVAAAAAQRLLTVPAEVSQFGVFDRLAPDRTSSLQMINDLSVGSNDCVGAPIRLYLRHLVPAARERQPQLRGGIEQRTGTFLRQAGVDLNDGGSVRVGSDFGIIYTAGTFAQRWGALPANWRIGEAIMKCYRAHLSQSPAPRRFKTHGTSLLVTGKTGRSPISRVVEYAQKHQRQLINLRKGKVAMNDATFAEAYGFLQVGGDGRLELLIRPNRMQREFPDHLTMMRELRNRDHARTEGGKTPKLSTKASIRTNKDDPDRVYCIRLPSGVFS